METSYCWVIFLKDWLDLKLNWTHPCELMLQFSLEERSRGHAVSPWWMIGFHAQVHSPWSLTALMHLKAQGFLGEQWIPYKTDCKNNQGKSASWGQKLCKGLQGLSSESNPSSHTGLVCALKLGPWIFNFILLAHLWGWFFTMMMMMMIRHWTLSPTLVVGFWTLWL